MKKLSAAKKSRLNKIGVFDVILVIFMILFMACIILPFVHIIAVSFSDRIPVLTQKVSFWPVDFTTYTYEQVFEHSGFLRAYRNTIFYTVVGTTLSLTATAMGGYALARRKMPGTSMFNFMLTVTLFFGGGQVAQYMAYSSYGIIDTVWAMFIPNLVNTYNLIILRSFFIAYPQEIMESGQIDGLQESGVFFRLVLPTSKAALATIGLYYAVYFWNAYMPARLYLRDENLYPVQHLLARLLASAGQMGSAEEGIVLEESVRYAAIIITVTPILCVYPFIQKYFVKGVMIGSIKG